MVEQTERKGKERVLRGYSELYAELRFIWNRVLCSNVWCHCIQMMHRHKKQSYNVCTQMWCVDDDNHNFVKFTSCKQLLYLKLCLFYTFVFRVPNKQLYKGKTKQFFFSLCRFIQCNNHLEAYIQCLFIKKVMHVLSACTWPGRNK